MVFCRVVLTTYNVNYEPTFAPLFTSPHELFSQILAPIFLIVLVHHQI